MCHERKERKEILHWLPTDEKRVQAENRGGGGPFMGTPTKSLRLVGNLRCGPLLPELAPKSG